MDISMTVKPGKLCIASWLMLPLIVIVSISGLVLPWVYMAEAFAWQQQAYGQDLVNLCLLCPALLLSTAGVWRKSKVAMAWWTGINVYLTYTFAIYCFSIHFNALFLLYCMVFSLSFFSAIAGIVMTGCSCPVPLPNNKWPRITSAFFLFISMIFCGLWLLDIIAGLLTHELPGTLAATGLLTNPVQVLDLSIILPGICITAIMALKHNVIALALQPVILVFMLLMDLTIAFLNVYTKGPVNAVGISMLLLAGISLYLLRRIQSNAI